MGGRWRARRRPAPRRINFPNVGYGLSGIILALKLMQNPGFKAQMDLARAELGAAP